MTGFLAELGPGFAFVGRQVPLRVGTTDFFLDLLFYHLRLRRYVVIELKSGPATPEAVGKLGFYLAVVDDLHRRAELGDDKTIGILLTGSRDDVVVGYALQGARGPMAADRRDVVPLEAGLDILIIRIYLWVMRKMAPALLPIFRSQNQAALLAWLYLRPGEEFTLSELARRLGVSAGALHAEVQRLVAAGLLKDRFEGRNRLLQANTDTRIARPLTELLSITYGPQPVIAEEFSTIEGAEMVVIYGSWARRYAGEVGREPADIDVMVIGSPDRDTVYQAAERSEARLQMPVNPTVRSMVAWQEGSDPLVITAKRDALDVLGGTSGDAP